MAVDPRALGFLSGLGSIGGPDEADKFHWADYLVFSLSLAVSLAIGIFFACTGDKQRTTEEFLLAGRNTGNILVIFNLTFTHWSPHLISEEILQYRCRAVLVCGDFYGPFRQ